MSEIVARGAEAVLTRDRCDGLDCLVKERTKKKYRIEELDENLRKKRTKQESKLLSEARRAGVPTPQTYSREKYVLKMEFLEGKKLRDVLPEASGRERKDLSETVGRHIARLHSSDIVHGDLTTSNMILVKNRIYFIDFGLGYHSQSVEDKAVDLYLLLEVLRSTHPENKDGIWEAVLEGYGNYVDHEKIINRMEDIEKRGRYVSG